MRDVDAIDRELSLLSVVRVTMRRDGYGVGTSIAMDRLLDERLAAGGIGGAGSTRSAVSSQRSS